MRITTAAPRNTPPVPGTVHPSTALPALLLFLLCGAPVSFSQEKPNPLFTAEQFDASANFRQSFCDEYRAVHNANGTLLLPDSLKGVAIRPILSVSEYFALDEESGGVINKDYPGLTAVLLDEFCRRAQCTWRNSFAVTGAPIENKTWTDLLLWTTNSYDLSVDWWASSAERMALGVAFPEPWYEADIIMVGKKANKNADSTFNLWAWLTPFDLGVWIMILVTIVISGLTYFGLENIDKHSDKRDLHNNPFDTTFLAAITFTTHFEFHPRTNAARLFSFWAMLVSAAYTANLASFLVTRNQPSLVIDTVEDAVRTNLPICTFASTQADVAVSKAFPRANFVRKDKIENVYSSVYNGECIVGITTVSSWEYFSRIKTVNGHCGLEWIGRTFRNVPAGFATIADSGTLCTSLLRDVINYHVTNMMTDGFVDEAWEQHFQQTTDWNCKEQQGAVEGDDVDAMTLTLKNLGGVFVFHFMLTGAALIIAFGARFLRYQKWKTKAAVVEEGKDTNHDTNGLDLSLSADPQEDEWEEHPDWQPRAEKKERPSRRATFLNFESLKATEQVLAKDFDDDASSISDQLSVSEGVKDHIAELRRQSAFQKRQLRRLREEMNDKLEKLIALHEVKKDK